MPHILNRTSLVKTLGSKKKSMSEIGESDIERICVCLTSRSVDFDPIQIRVKMSGTNQLIEKRRCSDFIQIRHCALKLKLLK